MVVMPIMYVAMLMLLRLLKWCLVIINGSA